MRTHKQGQKILSVFTSMVMLVQSLFPTLSLFTPQVFAQEVEPTQEQQVTPTPEPTIETTPTETPSPTETIAPTPTEEVTPTPTTEVTPEITPTPEVSVTPTEEVTPTPTQEVNPPSVPDSGANQPTGPPEQGQILDGASTTATPSPTITLEQPEQGELQAVVLQNIEAVSLDIDNIDPNNSASLSTDKADYAPTDTALITGTDFTAGETYTLIINSNDFPATSTTTQVTADENGAFIYAYQLDGIYRPNYKVEAKELNGTSVDIITFTDSDTTYKPPTGEGANHNEWSDGSNAFSNDGTYATETSRNDDQSYENFGFSVPAGATINGIEMNIEVKSSDTSGCRLEPRLWSDSDNDHSDRKNQNLTGSDTVYTLGGSGDLWGATWIASDFTDANFHAEVQFDETSNNSCNSSTVSLDYIQLKVYYTEAPPASDLTAVKTNNVSNNATTGQAFTWTIRVANAGPGSATFTSTQTILSDNLPNSNVSYGAVSIVKSDPSVTGTISCSSLSAFNLSCTASGGSVVIPAGQYIDVSFSATFSTTGSKVNPRSGGGICKVDPTGTNGVVNEGANEGNNTCTNTVTVASVQPAINPTLTNSCGIDVGLVVDTSTSIDSGELSTMKTALKNFVNAFIGTPTQMAVVSFDDAAVLQSGFTSNLSSLTVASGVIDDIDGSGYTNWEDAMHDTRVLFPNRADKPDLIVFTTDGDPTVSNADSNTNISQPNQHLDPAIVEANLAKATGIRVITLGIGMTGVDSQTRLQQISSADAFYSADNFDDLASTLQDLVNDLCGGTISVTKLIDADGNINTTNDRTPADNWIFNIGGQSGQETDVNGQTPAVTLTPAAGYDIAETPQAGYSLLSASCTGATSAGWTNLGDNTINDITIGTDDIVSCTFINTPNTGTINIVKVGNGVSNQQFGFNTTGGLFPDETPSPDFALDDNGEVVIRSNTKTFTGVAAGTYTVSEVATAGWTLASATCSDQSPVSAISLQAGETVTCTFTNTLDTGSIKVNKLVDLDGDGIFETTNPGTFTWNLNGSGSYPMGNAQSGFTTGIRNVDENSPAGYHPVGWFPGAPGGQYSCTSLPAGTTYTTLPASITIVDDLTTEITICNAANLTDVTVSKSDSPDPVANGGVLTYTLNVQNLTAVPAANVVVTDALPAGFAVTSVTPSVGSCSNVSAPSIQCELGTLGASASATVTIVGTLTTALSFVTNTTAVTTTTPESNENNNSDTEDTTVIHKGTITINKVIVPSTDPGLFNLTIKGVPYATNVTNGGTTGPIELFPGNYILGETAGTGTNILDYTVSYSSSCNDGLGFVELSGEENIVCTITNTFQPAHLTLVKTVTNNNGGSALNTAWTLSATGPTNISGTIGTTSITNASVNSGTYTLSESGGPSGYTGSTYSCVKNGGEAVVSNSITLDAGDNATCTITNDDIAPILTFTKIVNNQYGGILGASDFPLFINGGLVTTGVPNTLLANFLYTLTETQQPGYTAVAFSGDCSADGSIALSVGDNKTCTITNTDVQPKLTVTKVVINDNGGTKVVTDFPLFVDSTSVKSGAQTGLNAGTYIVNETGDSGYTSTITGDCAPNGSVTLSVGDVKSCTITNDDIPPSLQLIKEVLINNAGTAVVTDWTLTATGPTSISGASGVTSDATFDAGNYSLSESVGPAGYLASAWNCVKNNESAVLGSSITLDLGDSATCTITNSDLPGYLTVVKNVVGGTKTAADFSFSVNSGTPIAFKSGGNVITLSRGTYTVTEVTDPDYVTSYDNCSDIFIDNGESETCTVTNTKLGSIGGFKWEDRNGDGFWDSGEPALANWLITLLLDGFYDNEQLTGSDGSFNFTDLITGNYSLTETMQTGWIQTASPNATVLGAGDEIENQNFGNRGNLSITACKYEDSNGTQNGGNFTPVSNWNFTLGQTIQNTVDDNCTTFENLTPGTYDVSELPVRDGWYVADDSQGTRRVVLTDENQLVNFYNYQKGEISGTKWDDVNSNGERDDEPNLADWHIQLFEDNDGVKGVQVGVDQVTNSDGDYSFADVNPGDYFICEDPQDGWTQTYPNFDQDYSNCHEVTVTTGQEYGGKDFGNFKLGQIYGYKYEDTNGNGNWDEEEPAIEDWQICLNGDENCTYTDGDGYFEFTDLEYGDYTLTEDESNSDYQRTEPMSGSYDITIESGSGFGEGDVRYFGNAPLTDIGGYKWSDENGNGRRDCTSSDETERTECEDILGNWTIFLDENGNEQLDEEEKSTTTEDNTQSDNFGRYSFFDLLPGDYSICEVRQEGWNQTYPFDDEYQTYCHNITVPNDNEEYNFGNQRQDPILTITKVNDTTGDKAPGDTVLFTLTIEATQSAAYNVEVTDLPASGFTYVLGSWTANSTTRGDLKLAAITPEPTYASPGVWQLGDMSIGEIVTLTYSAKISNDQKSGIYKDLAWAKGCRTDGDCAIGDSMAVLSSAINPGFVDTEYVGTTVSVNKDTQNGGSLSVQNIGEVLGASTELPATGADNVWLLLIGLLFIAGLGLITKGQWSQKGKSMFHKFTKMTMLTVIALILATTFAGQAIAASLNIRISQPKSPTNQSSFPVSFVALDYENRPVTVKCFKKSPTDGSFVQFGANQNLTNGGNSGTCEVTNAILTDNGTYEFKVEAAAGADSTSATTSVLYNTSGPGDVKDYNKTKTNACEYTIHFKTAADAGKTVKVEVYRSENTSFSADAGTRIAIIALGSETAHDFTNTPPDCSKSYYFAVRAFDSAGNGSATIGDNIIVTTTTTTGATGTVGPTTGALVVNNQGGSVLGNATNASGPTGSTGGDTLGETTSPSAEITPTTTASYKISDRARLLRWVGAILLVGTLLYVIFKKKTAGK